MGSEVMYAITEIISQKGKTLLLCENYKFCFYRVLASGTMRWNCVSKTCTAFLQTVGSGSERQVCSANLNHNHEKISDRVLQRQIISTQAKQLVSKEPYEEYSKILCSIIKNKNKLEASDLRCIRNNMSRTRKLVTKRLSKPVNEEQATIEPSFGNVLEGSVPTHGIENGLTRPETNVFNFQNDDVSNSETHTGDSIKSELTEEYNNCIEENYCDFQQQNDLNLENENNLVGEHGCNLTLKQENLTFEHADTLTLESENELLLENEKNTSFEQIQKESELLKQKLMLEEHKEKMRLLNLQQRFFQLQHDNELLKTSLLRQKLANLNNKNNVS